MLDEARPDQSDQTKGPQPLDSRARPFEKNGRCRRDESLLQNENYCGRCWKKTVEIIDMTGVPEASSVFWS
ncbi:MAG TPA: hypothetical protein VKZ46_04855, partial [Pedomonas sp.]|nr:hypothetical protein [Pedomonas sp.]